MEDVLRNRYSLKLCKIHRKMSVLESLFNKLQATLLKGRQRNVFRLLIFNTPSHYCYLFLTIFFSDF